MGKHTLYRLAPVDLKNKTDRGYYADGGGLYFRVSEFGTTSWVVRFTLIGRAREMGLGSYPDVSIKEARDRAAEARRMIRDGRDPIEARQTNRSAIVGSRAAMVTFEECAVAFMDSMESEWKNAKHRGQWKATLQTYAYPVIGRLMVRDIDLPHILKIVEPIWATKTETATRVLGRIESVLDYAITRKYRAESNPARWRGYLDKVLPAPSKVSKVKHLAALPYNEIGAFTEKLRVQPGSGARALELAILTAARSGEIRGANWREFDLENAVWTIPENRMKAGKEHRIPLSAPALTLIRALPRGEPESILFPSSKGTPLSDMTLSAVLRRMEVQVTVHGFRSTFRDWAGETTAYPREVIEHALAHQLADKSEAAYARGTLFQKRRLLMDSWAKFCGTEKLASVVTGIGGLEKKADE